MKNFQKISKSVLLYLKILLKFEIFSLSNFYISQWRSSPRYSANKATQQNLGRADLRPKFSPNKSDSSSSPNTKSNSWRNAPRKSPKAEAKRKMPEFAALRSGLCCTIAEVRWYCISSNHYCSHFATKPNTTKFQNFRKYKTEFATACAGK